MSSRGYDGTATTAELYPRAERNRETLPGPLGPSARLICVVGPDLGRVVRLDANPVIIGRGRDCTVSLDNLAVSRHHVQIAWQVDRYTVTDLGSRNGTFVNGVPLTEPRALKPGDRVQVGSSTIFVFAHRDELEEQALRLQKLEMLAQLAGGLVHDFEKALTVIDTNVNLVTNKVRARLHEASDVLHGLDAIRQATDAGLALAQRMLFFARRNEAQGWTEFEVAALIADVIELVRGPLENQHIELVAEATAGMKIRGNGEELRHALLNLVLNARDAMREGGTLEIRATQHEYSQSEALALHLPLSGSHVELSVVDTGDGMDEATLSQVFEPLFTTKPAGQGAGLGLSTVYGIVRNHGGNTFAESALGRGTRIRLLLPLAPARAARP